MHMLLTVMLVFGMLMSCVGCNNPKQQASQHQTAPSPHSNANINAQQTGKRTIHDANAVKHRLTQLAKSVPGVRGVNCVVFGNTAIVGIDVDGNLERSRVGTMKYSVAEALSKDPYGANAIVTADLDLNNRLREISRDIQQGRPISGFTEELADIMGRIVPQWPSKIKKISPDTDNPKLNQSM
ncbi:YhcN/YlaJ family sporulation lipoprotein [Paenibacillus sp. 481]|uniref:YhcN/YlaJ family sporulation lipoprotein n=1 Tax=Paenibacillus sp. 481 TaxID=2835869 RepID=UPI001E558A35|nr:YhcN/YlaJ family sporulation lipoprotein [Paenibacillus sp. 481]UHA74144.1 YhcN/YlaJ family sporulation lipoprotein [Paenibacillus sp. 481]